MKNPLKKKLKQPRKSGTEERPIKTQPPLVVARKEKIFDWLEAWAKEKALFPFPIGSSCCSVEYHSMEYSSWAPYPFSPLGPWDLAPFARAASPEADLLLVMGTITEKMVPHLKEVYLAMRAPKWTVAIGGCAISGGPYEHQYHVINGLSKILPVDWYIPGCPPGPQELYEGFRRFQEHLKSASSPPQLSSSPGTDIEALSDT